jgi:hypothetical protein
VGRGCRCRDRPVTAQAQLKDFKEKGIKVD